MIQEIGGEALCVCKKKENVSSGCRQRIIDGCDNDRTRITLRGSGRTAILASACCRFAHDVTYLFEILVTKYM